MTTSRSLAFALSALCLAACAGDPAALVDPVDPVDPGSGPEIGSIGTAGSGSPGLIARAVLPAATFADGPLSGTQISGGLVGGFFPGQPVQGISSLVDAHDGSFLAMPDNGFGTLDNSADFHL